MLRVRAGSVARRRRKDAGKLAVVLCLCCVDRSGRDTRFWTEARPVVDGEGGGVEWGFGFDYSAIVGFLRRFPARIVVRVEFYEGDAGEVRVPGTLLRPRYVAEVGVFNEAVDGDGLARYMDEEVDVVSGFGGGEVDVGGEQCVEGQGKGEAWKVKLWVRGGPQWVVGDGGDVDLESREGVQVLLSYYSPALPWWNGIVMRDFSCPWCCQTFTRLRTLLVHFQSTHQDAKLLFESLLDEKLLEEPGAEERLPIVLNVSVFRVEKGDAGALDAGPARKRTARARKIAGQGSVAGVANGHVAEAGCVGVGSGPGSGSGSGAWEETQAAANSPAPNGTGHCCNGNGQMVNLNGDIDRVVDNRVVPGGLVSSTCSYCHRNYQAPAGDMFQFCGEWCEVLKKSERMRLLEEAGDKCCVSVPLRELASRPRPQKIDFDETLGKRQLFHLGNIPYKKSHFCEDDPDSEEELDRSWRLQLAEDAVAEADLPPKHKVLWTMWNRYVFDRGSPGAYGNQYTRYALEMFALEMREPILSLGLRVHLVAYLRALHIHGCIDAEALLSVVECLDGKRKLRQCRESRRPRSSINFPVGNGERAGPR